MPIIALVSGKNFPWLQPWWQPVAGHRIVFLWVILSHVTAVVGLVVSPLPSGQVLLAAVTFAWLGGIGTTVCYHRILAPRTLLDAIGVREVLVFLPCLMAPEHLFLGGIIVGLERLGLVPEVHRSQKIHD